MLTRLKVNGFKNLVDVDVRFGPFTCIAGVNGSGKSNLSDAIRFLAALAEKPLVEAALSVRGGSRSADIRDLFHRVGDHFADEMSFEAEMIVPAEGVDDLGQPIQAGSTFLRYSLTLGYRSPGAGQIQPPLVIKRERLETIGSDDVDEHLRFPHGMEWRESAIRCDSERGQPILSVPGPWRMSENGRPITPPDRADMLVPGLLPRTVLSVAQAVPGVESDQARRAASVTLARREMCSWRVFDLIPAAMRGPDPLVPSPQLGPDGSLLAATLYSVAHTPPSIGRDPDEAEAAVYARVAGRLYDLLGEVRDVEVERDDKRGELGLVSKDRDGTKHSARALSDGSLRFLALAVLEAQEQPEVLCIEEPENGIHPGRIQSLLDLLQAIAVDTRYPIEEGNPLRQVIMSTHSPSVVMRVPEDSLVVAELRDTFREGRRFNRAYFSGLTNTWRDSVPSRKSLPVGALRTYLSPDGYRPLPRPDPERDPDAEPRVMDRADVHRMLSPLPPD